MYRTSAAGTTLYTKHSQKNTKITSFPYRGTLFKKERASRNVQYCNRKGKNSTRVGYAKHGHYSYRERKIPKKRDTKKRALFQYLGKVFHNTGRGTTKNVDYSPTEGNSSIRKEIVKKANIHLGNHEKSVRDGEFT